MANFDMDALRTIIVGSDLGSFARAAIHLGRSQSAISMQLKKLEHQTKTQLFERKGRGLVPTEAGENFIAYARRIIALNDEAALSLGMSVPSASVRLGLPQDFFNDVMPATLTSFRKVYDKVHVNVRAGENYSIEQEVRAGHLDVAVAFFLSGSSHEGEVLCELPMRWLIHKNSMNQIERDPIPLVLFNHPCLFRQAALTALDQHKYSWRAALTTPSLPAVWGALRSGLGIAVRIDHAIPDDMIDIEDALELPRLPSVELRLLQAPGISEYAKGLTEVLRSEVANYVTNKQKTR